MIFHWRVWGARVWEQWQCGGVYLCRSRGSEPPSNKTEAWSELLSYDGSASTQNIPASAAARSVHCPQSKVSTVSTSRQRRGWWCEDGDVRMVMETQRSSSVLGLVISVCSVRWPAAQARTTHYSVLPLTHWFSEFSELGRLGEAFSQKSIFSPDSSEDAALAATHRHKQMKISSKVKSWSCIWSCFLLWYFHQWMWGESDVIMLYRRHNIELSSVHILTSPPVSSKIFDISARCVGPGHALH